MTLNFLVAPDFPPQNFAGWHLFNTVLQRRAGMQLHLVMPQDAVEQAALLDKETVDVLYANPFDAAELIRDKGYIPFARPVNRSNEMVIAVPASSVINRVEDLRPGCRIALTANHDVKLIGLRLLEPADLAEADVQWVLADSYQAAARQVIKGQVDAGFFLASAFHSLSRLTLSQLRPLVESSLKDISHVLIAHPRVQADLPVIRTAMLGIGSQPGDADVLEAMGLGEGLEPMDQEDAEFMIDLMDTLLD
ncbi:phosphate/phosphite/phosphonate ABC transporter substrate-binding protein [Corticibacter populi]|uniref:Phosphate/phosphite/phosphonate ABC transporter substrate-binding protein n=1 Tax=Corticibacter populi TaxID=1550736 RepID=A0A3M6QMC3_9BURK|nr:phosphate/phosphite/phosphonate ABC transporter substrate-binding protein [Corticibacter populi]RMX03552.1 phosphate/phosphite/phosphonate ABC transporter substrate-binding protein [Corticibacter populi]RZS30002.1 phosphonate transport system substrate-binding protein [Corticibacter populi]